MTLAERVKRIESELKDIKSQLNSVMTPTY